MPWCSIFILAYILTFLVATSNSERKVMWPLLHIWKSYLFFATFICQYPMSYCSLTCQILPKMCICAACMRTWIIWQYPKYSSFGSHICSVLISMSITCEIFVLETSTRYTHEHLCTVHTNINNLAAIFIFYIITCMSSNSWNIYVGHFKF